MSRAEIMSQPTRSTDSTGFLEAVHATAHPLNGDPHDYDPLINLIGDTRIVLLGAASHGTHEFYRERAEITKRLIHEKSFAAVAVEADWPDAYRVNRYVRGMSDDPDAIEALGGFQRFPAWMWRNTDVVEFVNWLRAHNDQLQDGTPKIGFYGLDLYSLRASRQAVIKYLDKVDPRARDRLRAQYACFDDFGDNARGYGVLGGIGRPCRDAAVAGVVELQQSRATREARRKNPEAEEEYFTALQNARVVRNAEGVYSAMYRSQASAWNLREQHMAVTLDDLMAHLSRQGNRAKIAVWAHSSHLGDGRATEKREDHLVNVGQLVREQHGGETVLIAFTTNRGTVTAASDWDGPPEIKELRPAFSDSYEALFHDTQIARFMISYRGHEKVPEVLCKDRPERSIGAVYHSETPEAERAAHYFIARLAEQFDAVLYFDETRAIEPIEFTRGETTVEVPLTYPFEV
jgi:erythromycin esterase-like protein